MEDDVEGLKALILEELTRLGVQTTSEGKASQGGSRLLAYNTNASKSGKLKSKGKRSPRASAAKSPHTKQGHSKGRDERKHTPKSPFAAAKRKAELRKQNAKEKGLVFGRELGHVPSVCVYMSDGTQVTVAEFLVDVCNLVRRNITVEGIFRKAGSSQRQSDIKKLIDSGSSLPNSVHVIDGACLLKQFLRSLPTPLLSSEVHNKTIKCMQLGKEARVEAVTLCTMLLPLANRHTLVYLMDFLSDVVAASGSNLMDAHNLAIVLAPNLLPTSITVNNRKGSAGPLHSEDAMLATNIEILQLLIENAPRLCRLPNNVALALEHREQSRSTENLLTPSEPHPVTRKKRRSASIHRLMTGLRRVVGHSSGGGGSPIRMSGSAECLDSLHLHPGIALSPMPGSGGSPRKRKSSDAFDLGLEACRDPADHLQGPSPPSHKRAKVEGHGGNVGASATTTVDAATSSVSSIPLTVNPFASSAKSRTKMGQPFTIKEIPSTWNVFPQPSAQPSIMGYSKSSLKRSTSAKVNTLPKSPGTNLHTNHQGVSRKSLGRTEHIGGRALISKTSLDIANTIAMVKIPVVKRRSCDIPLRSTEMRGSISEDTTWMRRRSSGNWRKKENEPDGEDVSTLGPRGVPDGAECILRDKVMPTPAIADTVETLEQQYDDIKSVVKNMEEEVDKNNVQQLKETYFPDSSSLSAQNMSYSEMIQSAYERMKVETKDLEISPSDNLSKRLGKELKIRNRRSSEHRVIRSPSERKIGTIRRRSRELVQNAAKSLINVEDTPANKPAQTPRMKGALMQTPINTALKRGRPNSVKSGLPFVVRALNISSDSVMPVDETPNSSRTVVVNRRNGEQEQIQRLQITNQSLYNRSNEREKIFENSEVSGLENTNSNLSLSSSLPALNTNDSLMGSFLEQFPGPMTRRRSSILSASANSVLLIHSAENSISIENQGDGRITMSCHSSECMDVDEEPMNNKEQMGNQNKSAVYAFPAVVVPESGRDESWVPAADFIDHIEDMEDDQEDGVTENAGRPSLAALMKQKKVTANVRLFSNLETATPAQRRQSRIRGTPHRLPPQRGANSECRGTKLKHTKSMPHRSTMTPRELLKARQKSFHFDKSPHNLAKVAVVSPLKESTWINIQQEHSRETTKPHRGEATTPQRKFHDEVGFKTPIIPRNFLRSQSTKSPGTPFVTPAETPSAQPPKLPPRASVKPSPIRVQYR
ncbi:uncharacterized protein LOC119590603 [Penaeus monodon]|uniref:uncharacterized protein LOC119590603 n=1 Tax=Penaeus monodon TaxID=6687 RepID=UPI0018A73E4B|nr:uncharacterized protein LOC119590603 [Penaeus monodon]